MIRAHFKSAMTDEEDGLDPALKAQPKSTVVKVVRSDGQVAEIVVTSDAAGADTPQAIVAEAHRLGVPGVHDQGLRAASDLLALGNGEGVAGVQGVDARAVVDRLFPHLARAGNGIYANVVAVADGMTPAEIAAEVDEELKFAHPALKAAASHRRLM